MSDPRIEKAEVEPAADTETEAIVEPARGRRRRTRSMATDNSVNMVELRELIQLIRENDFSEFELEREGFRVRFRRGGELMEASAGSAGRARELSASSGNILDSNASVPSAPPHPGAKAQTEASEDQGLHIIPSPIVGTFYRAASPTADAFVKIGSIVEADTVVCIIEAMKLMNEIQAETAGEVAKIYVENGQPVEYGQPLFGIKR
ncbi:MAG TPA: acetyl-CoA carboxylase biotin carboxyl carrier protein [Pyrinomonadaceae bacterium]|jgi:acetyl-CoA carboxylase biotin carboxyl carrier protein